MNKLKKYFCYNCESETEMTAAEARFWQGHCPHCGYDLFLNEPLTAEQLAEAVAEAFKALEELHDAGLINLDDYFTEEAE